MRIFFRVSLLDQELLPYPLSSVDRLCYALVYSHGRDLSLLTLHPDTIAMYEMSIVYSMCAF